MIDECGDDKECADEQSEDAKCKDRAKSTILEGSRRSESAELGGNTNGNQRGPKIKLLWPLLIQSRSLVNAAMKSLRKPWSIVFIRY